jgi:HEAT repeat protein
VAPLVSALADEDWAVRRDVAEALGQIRAPAATSHLNNRLGDDHPRVRIAVVRALAELGSRAALPQALRREADPEVRLHLVEALGSATTAASRRALEGALSDDVQSVRLLAASFLVERGNVEAVNLLGDRLANGATATARQEAAEALGRSEGDATAPARRLLCRALVDPSTDVSLAAAASLVALGDRRGREFLRSIVDGENTPELRARALEMLEEAGGD